MLIYFRLVDAGYGSYNEVKQFDARVVAQALHYLKFKSDYEATYMELNKK